MKTYREEYEAWRQFLNRETTYFMVASGISIIALSSYQELVIVIFIFVTMITYSSGKFPRLITELRNKKRTRSENYKYYGILKTDFGWKSFWTNFFPYSLASIFLISILIGVWN